MLVIRLQRVGRKNDPSFRVVVTDSKNAAKSGKFMEVVGSYDARQGTPILKADRIKHWISVGAQVSDTVHNLLVRNQIITGRKKKASPVTKPKVVETPAVQAAPVAAEEAVAPAEVPAEEATPAAE